MSVLSKEEVLPDHDFKFGIMKRFPNYENLV
jgi:hypothetical protein